MSDINHQPCPVCGSNDILHGEVLSQFSKSGKHTVQSTCNDCGVEGPHAILAEGEIDYGDLKAISAWNSWAADQGAKHNG